MKKLTYNRLETNPGFIGDITHEQAKQIALIFNLQAEDQSDGSINTDNTFIFTDENESILIESGYGLSFNLEKFDEVKNKLIEIGFEVN